MAAQTLLSRSSGLSLPPGIDRFPLFYKKHYYVPVLPITGSCPREAKHLQGQEHQARQGQGLCPQRWPPCRHCPLPELLIKA